MGTTEVQRLIDNKSLNALRKFAATEKRLKALKEKHDMIVDQVRVAMIENGVTRIDGDWGYITLAERTTYKADDIDRVSPQYTKKTLDTAKVKAQAVLTGEVPAGITESKTQYITKKFKEIKE